MKPENADYLRQELRLAQLEIKLLREQLSRSAEELQKVHAESEEPVPEASEAQPRVILPMVPHDAAKSNGSAAAHCNGGRPWVLCVEDSEPNFRLIENVLRERPGTDLGWAETGEKALVMARENPPQLVLLDLDLPDMHGSKVLEGLQSQPGTEQTPVIVISADATPSQIERMLSAGARNYLTKPFDIRRFLCMFDEAVGAAV
jgi:CheY-like chemotaxis protein